MKAKYLSLQLEKNVVSKLLEKSMQSVLLPEGKDTKLHLFYTESEHKFYNELNKANSQNIVLNHMASF